MGKQMNSSRLVEGLAASPHTFRRCGTRTVRFLCRKSSVRRETGVRRPPWERVQHSPTHHAVIAGDLVAGHEIAQHSNVGGATGRGEFAGWIAVCKGAVGKEGGRGVTRRCGGWLLRAKCVLLCAPTMVDVGRRAQPELGAVAAVGEHDAKVVFA